MKSEAVNEVVSSRMALEGVIGDLLEQHVDLVHITTDGSDYVSKCRERRFDVGIAEANLINVATGFALKDMRVVVNGIASFVLYNAYLQVRNNISHHNLPVVVIGVGAGLSYGHLGATHHALEDIACLYTLPNIDIYLPADGFEAAGMLRQAVESKRPAYIRIRNGQEPVVSSRKEYCESTNYDLPVTVGDGSDVGIISYGATVTSCLRVADLLSEEGVLASVVCIRTLSRDSIEEAIRRVKECQHIVVVEEHYDDTGVGSILGKYLGDRMQIVGVKKNPEHYGGTSDELLRRHGLDVDSIMNKIRNIVSKEKIN